MSKFIPDRKVIGSLGSLIAFFLLAALEHFGGIVLDPDLITTLVVGAGGLMAYVVPQPVKEAIEKVNTALRKGQIGDGQVREGVGLKDSAGS